MVFGVDALRFLESVLEVTIRQAASMGGAPVDKFPGAGGDAQLIARVAPVSTGGADRGDQAVLPWKSNVVFTCSPIQRLAVVEGGPEVDQCREGTGAVVPSCTGTGARHRSTSRVCRRVPLRAMSGGRARAAEREPTRVGPVLEEDLLLVSRRRGRWRCSERCHGQGVEDLVETEPAG